jgi:hypothetical protein
LNTIQIQNDDNLLDSHFNFSSDGNFILYYNEFLTNINIFSIKENKITDKIKIEMECNFCFMNVKKGKKYLIIINKNHIIQKVLGEEKINESKLITLPKNKKIIECFYDYKLELIYILTSDFFYIIDLLNAYIIYKNDDISKIKMINLKKDNTQKFLCYTVNNSYALLILASKERFKNDKIISSNLTDNEKKNIISLISDISKMKFTNLCRMK